MELSDMSKSYKDSVSTESTLTRVSRFNPPAFIRPISHAWQPPSSWQSGNAQTEALHVQGQDRNQPSLYQKYFTEATGRDRFSQRRFSLLSRGCIFVALLVVLVLGGVAAAVDVNQTHHHHQEENTNTPDTPNTQTPPFDNGSPILTAIDVNFSDPSLIFDNDIWYAFATNSVVGKDGILNDTRHDYGKANVQLATSTNFANWTVLANDPLPTTGSWAEQGLTNAIPILPPIPAALVWSPQVIQRPSDTSYILYYAAQSNNVTAEGLSKHCIGAALSATPAGPYAPLDYSFPCPVEEGGAIDPYGIVDNDGTIYLAYKVNGNNIGKMGQCRGTSTPPTPIMLQRILSDGVTPDGDAVMILNRTVTDGSTLEAPAIVRSSEGIYFLFFSSGCTQAQVYRINYATATNIYGPYTRAPGPFLSTGIYVSQAESAISWCYYGCDHCANQILLKIGSRCPWIG